MKSSQVSDAKDLPPHKAGVILSIPLLLLIDYMELYHLQPTLGNPAPAFKPDPILIVKRKTDDLKPA